jgi:hypothetical protein
MDPVARLVRDLERYGRPGDGWLSHYSSVGPDPVAVAWAESRDGMAMTQLLQLADRRDLSLAALRARQAAAAAIPELADNGISDIHAAPRLGVWNRVVAELARTLREAVPRPPNLLELQRGAARARRPRTPAPAAPAGRAQRNR